MVSVSFKESLRSMFNEMIEIKVSGANHTPYEGLIMTLHFHIQKTYPDDSIECYIVEPIYHLNVE